MLALTVRQPWAWAIIHAGKDVENRSWPTEYRGPLAIHAATKLWRGGGVQIRVLAGLNVPADDELIRGAVIGIVDVVGCIRNSHSQWAFGDQWHWELANPRALPESIPLRGQPGLFHVQI